MVAASSPSTASTASIAARNLCPNLHYQVFCRFALPVRGSVSHVQLLAGKAVRVRPGSDRICRLAGERFRVDTSSLPSVTNTWCQLASDAARFYTVSLGSVSVLNHDSTLWLCTAATCMHIIWTCRILVQVVPWTSSTCQQRSSLRRPDVLTQCCLPCDQHMRMRRVRMSAQRRMSTGPSAAAAGLVPL